MSDTRIEVRQARVRSPRRLAAPQGLRARLEDALRTSSKPAVLAHRFVLVQSMQLKLAEAASAQTIALALEREWQAIAARARPIELAGAHDDVVWADDLTAAHCALVQRWSRGEAPQAWYWQRLEGAVPQAGAWPERALALMLEPAEHLERTARKQHAPRLLQAVAEAGGLQEFLAALAPAQAGALVQTLKLHDAVRRAFAPQAARADLARSAAQAPAGADITRLVPGFANRFEAPLDHDLLLACAALGMVTSAAPHPPRAMSQAHADVSQRVAPVSAEASPAQAGFAWPIEADAARATEPDALELQVRKEAAAVPRSRARPAQPLLPAAGAPSAWAGLLFMIMPLMRCGLGDLPRPEIVFAQLLDRVLDRVLVRWCGPTHGHHASNNAPNNAPDDPALAWAQSLVARHAADVDAHILAASDLAWRQLRLSCLRDVGLPLRQVLHRRGQWWNSAHRIDIVFPLHDADVRLRRAGVDLDPGYIPWLDAVVRFHYSDQPVTT